MPKYDFECQKCHQYTELQFKPAELDGLKTTPPSCPLCGEGPLLKVILTAPCLNIPFNMSYHSQLPDRAKQRALEDYRGTGH